MTAHGSSVVTSWAVTQRPYSCFRVTMSFPSRVETLVGCLNKHIRRPIARITAVDRIIVPGWLGRLHLIESHAALDHVLKAVSDDGDHLLIDIQIPHVTKPSMARDDHRTPFHVVSWNRHLPQAVQSLEHPLKTPSVLQVDDGVFRGIENIARADDVGAPKKYDAVPVRGRRLMKYLDRFTVKIKVLLGHRIRVVWPGFFRYGRSGVGIAHPLENRAEGNDKNARPRGPVDGQGRADLCEVLIAACMIGSVAGINNVGDLTFR